MSSIASNAEGLSVVLVNAGMDSAFKASLRERYNYPPCGLLSLASVLGAHGYDVHLIDLFSEALTRDNFASRLHAPRGRVLAVGISTYTDSLHLVLRLTEIVRMELPDAKIVLGGVHTSFRPEDGLRVGTVDYVVRGEGEATIVALMELIKYPGRVSPSSIPGIAYREGSEIRSTVPRPYIPDVDQLPFPAYQLMADNPAYSHIVSVVSSRGCPGRCIFCSSRAYSGQRYRMHSAEWLFSLLYFYKERLRAFSVISFMDDTFTANKKRLRRFAWYVRKSGWGHTWACKSRVDTLNEEAIRLLSESGCRSIHIGVESADQTVLDSIDKGIDIRRCFDVISLLNRYNIKPECSFMIGLPEDTRQTIDKTLILASEINAAGVGQALVAIATPFPGTKMSDQIQQDTERVVTYDWRNYTTMKPIFYTRNFTVHDLRKAFHALHYDRGKLSDRSIVSDCDLSEYRAGIRQWTQSIVALKPGAVSS